MANRGLGTLTLNLIAKIGGFTGPLSQAERELDKRSRAMQKRAQQFGKQIGTALGVGIATAATVAIAGLKTAIDRMDEMRDASIRLGVGVETLSAFGYAAQQTGTDIDDLGKGLKILAKNAADALNPKTSQSKLFEALNVSVKDAQGNLRDLDDLIPDIADRFKELEDGTTKAALAQQLFGKSGLQLTEFLNQGSAGLKEMTDKARELGLVIDQDAADKADKFNDTLNDLKGAALGLALNVASDLLPELQRLADWAREFTKDAGNANDIADKLATTFDVLAGVGHAFSSVFEIVGATLASIAATGKGAYDILKGIATLDFSNVRDGTNLIKAGASGLWDEIKEGFGYGPTTPAMPGKPDFSGVRGSFVGPNSGGGIDRNALNRALSGVTGGGSGRSKAKGLSDEQKEAERLKQSVDDLNASYAEQIALFGKTGEAAKLRYEFEQEDLSKLDPATRAYIEAKREEILVAADRLDQMRDEKEVQEQLDQINKQRADATAQVLDDIKTERDLLGQTAQYQDTYNKLKYAGVDANSAFGQSIIAANDALWAQKEATADQVDTMDALRDSARGFLSDLKDGAEQGKSAWDALKDAVDNFADALFNIIANNLVEKALGQQGTTGTGSSGGWFEKAATWLASMWGSGSAGSGSAAAAASSGGSFAGPRAGGGSVMAGRLYRVNEQNPEMLTVGGRDYLMMGAKSGYVTPHPQMQPAANAPAIGALNISIQGNTDSRTATQIAAKAGYEVARAQRRNGGR